MPPITITPEPIENAPQQSYSAGVYGAPEPAQGQRLLSQTAQDTLSNALTYGVAQMGVGLADTVGQSVGVFDDTTVETAMKDLFPGGAGDYYGRNKTALRAGGEILGLALPGIAAYKLVNGVRHAREIGRFGQYLKNSTAANALLGNAATLTNAERNVYQVAQSIPRTLFGGRTVKIPALDAARATYTKARVAEAVRQTAIFEASYRTLYNQSELFYPSDYTLSDEIKWAGGGAAIGVGLDYAMGRYSVRRLIQAAQASRPLAVEGAELASQVIFRPGDRGAGMTYFAAQKTQWNDIAKNSPEAVVFGSNVNQDANAIDGVLKKQMEEMAADPHVILPRAALNEDQKKLVLSQLEKNETSLLFATKLGKVPDNAIDFYTSMNKKTGELKDKLRFHEVLAETKPGDKANIAELNKAKKAFDEWTEASDEVHMVLESTGDYSVYRNRADNWLDNHSFFDNIKQKTEHEVINPTAPKENRRTVARMSYSPADNSGAWTLDDRFIVTYGANATQMDRSAVFAAASRMVQKWKPVENQQEFVLNEKLPWFQLEGILTLAEQNPAAKEFIKFDGKLRNLDDVKFEIAAQKYEGFMKDMGQTERSSRSSIAALKRLALDPSEIMQKYNLPIGQGLVNHPLMEVFAAGKMQNHKSLYDMLIPGQRLMGQPNDSKMSILQAAMRDAAQAPAGKEFDWTGKLFLQKDVRPVFVAGKSIPTLSYSEALIHGMIETRRDLALSRLSEIDPKDAPIVSAVFKNTLDTGALDVAKDVQSLMDGLSGKGNVVYQDRINEQWATLKAAALKAQENEKVVNELVSAMTAKTLTPLTHKLLDGKNKPILFDFNRIEHAYRHGWDIKGIERHESGKFRFVLNNTPHNDELMRQYFGKSLSEANVGTEATPLAYLPDMSPTSRRNGNIPLYVHEDAANAAKAMSDLSRQSGIEYNALRVAMGKSPITIRDFHLPTPEISKEGAHFVHNSQGKVVGTYSGGTAAQNKQRSDEAAGSLFTATGEQHSVSSWDDRRRSFNIWDDTFFNWIDWSDQAKKSGYKIKGGLQRTEIDSGPETLKAMASTLNEQFLSAGTRARAAIFEPQLNYADNVSQTLGNTSFGPNIFDRYQAIIYGRGPQQSSQAVTKVYNAFESQLDKSLTWLNARYSESIASTKAGQAGARSLRQVLRGQTTEFEFQQMNKNLPSFSPFQTTEAWMESTYRERPRVTSRKLAANIANVSSAMSLRVMDVGIAMLNLAGNVITAPSIVRGMRQLPGEDRAGWLVRTAAYRSDVFGEDRGVPSSMKIMTKAIHDWWKGDLTAPLARAAKQGFFKPEYTAITEILTDPIQGGKTTLDKWVEGASWLADNSEILSRKIAWSMGYNLGKDIHKFSDERDLFIYAHNFMNEMVGNYNPKNKPAMFRGAMGLPLGAFQTYMFNFYRRMYGYLERKDFQSIAAAYASQASVFGAQSVPGWSAFNSLMFDNYDGSDSLATRLDRKLPAGAGELVLHGSLSSIGGIFGHPDANIAFYPRGSVDINRAPPNFTNIVSGQAFTERSAVPAIAMMQQIGGGIKRTVDNVFGASGFSPQQQTEILAQMTTNRFFTGLMETVAGGRTDQVGQRVDVATFDAVNVAARMMGTLPSETRRAMDAYNSQQVVQLNQQEIRSKLNDKTRALIRGGELSVERLQPLVHEYMRSGGNPAYFGTWLRNTIETATIPKATRQLDELSRSGKWMEFLNLLTALQQNEPPPERPRQ